MRLAQISAIASLVLLSSQPVGAQAPTLLNQLEQRIQGAGSTPGGGAAVPGTGYLGAVVDEEGEQGRGVRVISAKPGAPAANGGLKDGDLIVGLDGRPVTGLRQLDEVLDRAVPGQKLQMSVDRGGTRQPLTITLGTRPATAATGDANPGEPLPGTPTLAPPATSPAAPRTSSPFSTPAPATGTPALSPPTATETPPPLPVPGTADSFPRGSGIRATPLDLGPPPSDLPSAGGGASLGITVVPLTDQVRLSANFPVRRGALIAAIRPGSPADTAGMPTGGLVVRIDNRAVDSADDLVSAIKAARPGQEVELAYYEGDQLRRKSIRLGPASATAAPGGPIGGGPIGGGLPSARGYGVPGAPGPLTLDDGGLRPAPGGGGARPLLERIEQMAENLTRPTGTTTVYDPLTMAALQTRVVELSEEVKALQDRIKELENKLRGGPPAAAGPALTPSGPSFGPGTGTP